MLTWKLLAFECESISLVVSITTFISHLQLKWRFISFVTSLICFLRSEMWIENANGIYVHMYVGTLIIFKAHVLKVKVFLTTERNWVDVRVQYCSLLICWISFICKIRANYKFSWIANVIKWKIINSSIDIKTLQSFLLLSFEFR